MENVKKFYDALASDEAMRGRANALGDKHGETNPSKSTIAAELVAFAKAEGYDFSEKELAEYAEQPYPIDDDELDAVAGGVNDTEKCMCIVGGGGTYLGVTCACVAFGGGAQPTNLVCLVSGTMSY